MPGWVVGAGRAEKRSFKVSVDGDDLTIVKNRIYLTWHQKNMISLYQLLFWMVAILVRYVKKGTEH